MDHLTDKFWNDANVTVDGCSVETYSEDFWAGALHRFGLLSNC
jgi:hypothetical protein